MRQGSHRWISGGHQFLGYRTEQTGLLRAESLIIFCQTQKRTLRCNRDRRAYNWSTVTIIMQMTTASAVIKRRYRCFSVRFSAEHMIQSGQKYDNTVIVFLKRRRFIPLLTPCLKLSTSKKLYNILTPFEAVTTICSVRSGLQTLDVRLLWLRTKESDEIAIFRTEEKKKRKKNEEEKA